jgi:UDP-N-acetylglucosamine--N-acetylmuramyl-(pentapeptide) pyrophosphoryl-undecaprenol N-acetylglucosamine transferase
MELLAEDEAMTPMTRQRMQFFFAGGGTGGHIYPALAVAAELMQQQPKAEVVFFCSSRAVDARVLAGSGYEFFPLPAEGFSPHPVKAIRFVVQFLKSYYFAKQILLAGREESVVIGTGGFVSAPVIFAARSLRIPVCVLNVDYVPGKANRMLARFAQTIFTQYDQTAAYFEKRQDKVVAAGCPLRKEFAEPQPDEARQTLGLDADKKILLITGASSGSRSINEAMLKLLPHLAAFADDWQVVHLTGQAHYHEVKAATEGSSISYHPVDYYDRMADLYAASEIIVGRSGAVSVAEYAAAGRPAVCLPYPYHKDKHQTLNAAEMVEAGGAVVVEDIIGNTDQTAAALMDVLRDLMAHDARRARMAAAARSVARPDAAARIAKLLLAF